MSICLGVKVAYLRLCLTISHICNVIILSALLQSHIYDLCDLILCHDYWLIVFYTYL